MFIRTHAGAICGIDAVAVTVEVNIAGGGLGLYLVGLPDNAVKESEQRIRSAFENSGERMSGRKVVVSLAPADLRKEGSGFDLPIAVGILAAMGRIGAAAVEDTMFVGELSLDGRLNAVRGVLPLAICAREAGLRRLVLPQANAAEAAVVEGLEVYGVGTLADTVAFLNGEKPLVPQPVTAYYAAAEESVPFAEDFADVRGQSVAKRALEIAAAGGHNVLMVGSPGSGKTMLARRLPTILPPLTPEEALETTKIHSVAGKIGRACGLMTRRPFRAPHHLTSQVALIGGGQSPNPGEVSLAHNGVLFLDELPEFGRSTLEVLRQPLEEKRVVVSRARYSVEYPANFILVAAMNPCPCDYYNHPSRECICSPGSVQRYMRRISGPRSYRPAHRGNARGSGRALGGGSGRTECRDPRTGRPGPRGAGGALPRCARRAYECDDEQCHVDRILPSRRRFGGAARAGHDALRSLGPGLRPHPAGGAHDRRPGRTGGNHRGRYRRGDQLPYARPWHLGALSGRRQRF